MDGDFRPGAEAATCFSARIYVRMSTASDLTFSSEASVPIRPYMGWFTTSMKFLGSLQPHISAIRPRPHVTKNSGLPSFTGGAKKTSFLAEAESQSRGKLFLRAWHGRQGTRQTSLRLPQSSSSPGRRRLAGFDLTGDCRVSLSVTPMNKKELLRVLLILPLGKMFINISKRLTFCWKCFNVIHGGKAKRRRGVEFRAL